MPLHGLGVAAGQDEGRPDAASPDRWPAGRYRLTSCQLVPGRPGPGILVAMPSAVEVIEVFLADPRYSSCHHSSISVLARKPGSDQPPTRRGTFF